MTLFQYLFDRSSDQDVNVHDELVKRCKEMVFRSRCWGVTTGEIFWRLKDTALGRVIIRRGPADEALAIQNFKSQIGQALDELQEQKLVHCDKIGKRQSIGCDRSSPVWRSMEDWQAYERSCVRLLRPERLDGRNDYPKQARKHFENQSNQFIW